MKTMEVLLATNNLDKVKEIKKVLAARGLKIFTLNDAGLNIKVREDGKTIKENAIKKARVIADKSGKIALADDTGLEVKELKGQLGVRSSRFAGYGCTYDDNNKKLLRLLRGVPKERRQAKFMCCIAIARPKGLVRTVMGICPGRIAEEKKGKNGFGYDPIFIPNGHGKTFAEIKITQKNRISHRAKALNKAKKIIIKMRKQFLS